MAIMRPSEFPENLKNQRDREDFVFEMLKKNLPADAVVIYEPLVFNRRRQNRKPDFVIFWPGVGCFVMEVKNWSREAITGADDRSVYYDNETPRTNPFRSSQSHCYAVIEHLEQHGCEESGVLQSDRQHKGKVSFPVMPSVLLLGTKDSDIDDWAKLLCVDGSVLVSEQTLRDPEALQNRIKRMPRVFPGDRQAQVLRNAADILQEGSDVEPSVDAATRSIDKLKQQLAAPLVKDLETLASHRSLLATVAESLATMIAVDYEEHPNAKNLLGLRDDLYESRLRVGMFGTSAAGKSTLTNALLGKTKFEPDLMREGLGRTTRVITRILPVGVEPSEGHRCSVLRYKSIHAVATEVTERLENLGILKEEFPDPLNPINLDDPQHRKWLESQVQSVGRDSSLQDRDQSNALKAFLEGWNECHTLLGHDSSFGADCFEEAEALIHGTRQPHASYVAERIIFHDNRLTQYGIELIDAPGVGAAVQDDDRALEIAQSSDAFVIVSDVKFQFMKEDRQFLSDAVDVTRGKRDNLLFVINQISKIVPDQCDPPVDTFDEAVDSQVDRFRATLAEYGVEAANIWPVDALAGKLSRHMLLGKPNGRVCSNFERHRFRDLTDADANLQASRIEQLEESLIRHLTKHTYTDVMCDKISRLEKEMVGYQDDLTARIDNINEDIESVEEGMEIHKKSRKRVRLQLDGFFSKQLPTQLKKHKKELDEDIASLIEFSIDQITEKIKRNWSKPKVTTIALVNSAIEESEPTIRREIARVREIHEKHWQKIREKALAEELPEILSEYGDVGSMVLKRKNIESVMRKRIQALRNIRLGSFQHAFAIIWGSINGLRDGGYYDGQRKAIQQALRKNFASRVEEVMRSDVMRWVKDDRKYLAKQTLEHFTDVMDEIEAKIAQKIDEIKRHEHERDTYEVKLEHFRDQAAAKQEDLRELRKAIEKHRPMKAQAIA